MHQNHHARPSLHWLGWEAIAWEVIRSPKKPSRGSDAQILDRTGEGGYDKFETDGHALFGLAFSPAKTTLEAICLLLLLALRSLD